MLQRVSRKTARAAAAARSNGVHAGGGNGGNGGNGGASPAASGGVSLSWAPDSRKVDKAGATDGAVGADGTKDIACVAEIEGPVTALFVAAVTGKGEPTGDWQADTLVGNQALPIELSLIGSEGKTSAGIVVYEGDKLLTAPDGSLKGLGAGSHKLILYMNDHAATKDGIRLFVQKGDGSIAKSGILR